MGHGHPTELRSTSFHLSTELMGALVPQWQSAGYSSTTAMTTTQWQLEIHTAPFHSTSENSDAFNICQHPHSTRNGNGHSTPLHVTPPRGVDVPHHPQSIPLHLLKSWCTHSSLNGNGRAAQAPQGVEGPTYPQQQRSFHPHPPTPLRLPTVWAGLVNLLWQWALHSCPFRYTSQWITQCR